jgi:hypothetical protein
MENTNAQQLLLTAIAYAPKELKNKYNEPLADVVKWYLNQGIRRPGNIRLRDAMNYLLIVPFTPDQLNVKKCTREEIVQYLNECIKKWSH